MPRHPLRLNILSDLHLSQGGLPLPDTGADVVVLAGDIARPQKAIEWARGFAQPVIYVAGNHEYYGSSPSATLATLKDLAHGTNIHVLDQDAITLCGVRFIGATLWTGFNLCTQQAQRRQAEDQAVALLRDFNRIKSDRSPGGLFTPQESIDTYERHCAWLAATLVQPFDGPTVVVTHHAPSPKSIHPRFEGSLLNNCFVSDAEHLFGTANTPLWVHGHTHDSFDYTIENTRVVCNPRGYCRNGVNENALFDPNFVVDVAR
jgi:predicted phosphodiesterase